MRVVKAHDGPGRLRIVLASNHWLLATFGAIFMAAGAAVLWMMAYDVRLIVVDGAFGFTRRFLGLVTVEDVTLAATEIGGVTIDLVTSLGGLSRSYEVTLAGPDGIWRPWLAMADGDAKRGIAAGVQQALADHSRKFEYAENGSVPGLILGGMLMVAGVYVVSFIQAIVIAGNRQQGSVVITRRRLLFPGGVRRTLAIADIVRCKAEASTFRTTRGQSVTSYHVILQVRDDANGEEDAPLGFGPSFTHAQASSLARTINNWLEKAR